MIDKISRKALKFISKNGEVRLDAIYADFGEYGEQIINSLCEEGYVEQVLHHPAFNINDFAYVITPKGKAYFEERRIEKIRYWTPIIISLFAAIGAYRKEMMQLLQAIMQLLK